MKNKGFSSLQESFLLLFLVKLLWLLPFRPGRSILHSFISDNNNNGCEVSQCVWVLVLSFAFLKPVSPICLDVFREKLTPEKNGLNGGAVRFGDLLLMSFWVCCRKKVLILFNGVGLCRQVLKVFKIFVVCWFNLFVCSPHFEFGANKNKMSVMKKFFTFYHLGWVHGGLLIGSFWWLFGAASDGYLQVATNCNNQFCLVLGGNRRSMHCNINTALAHSTCWFVYLFTLLGLNFFLMLSYIKTKLS